MTDARKYSPIEPDHWNAEHWDDQSIHYRIADLLQEILNELRELRKKP